MSGFFTTIRNRKKPVNILIEMVNVGKMSGFFTTIRNRKKPVNILIDMVNVGKIYFRNSNCLGFLLQLEIVKNLEIVHVGNIKG